MIAGARRDPWTWSEIGIGRRVHMNTRGLLRQTCVMCAGEHGRKGKGARERNHKRTSDHFRSSGLWLLSGLKVWTTIPFLFNPNRVLGTPFDLRCRWSKVFDIPKNIRNVFFTLFPELPYNFHFFLRVEILDEKQLKKMCTMFIQVWINGHKSFFRQCKELKVCFSPFS